MTLSSPSQKPATNKTVQAKPSTNAKSLTTKTTSVLKPSPLSKPASTTKPVSTSARPASTTKPSSTKTVVANKTGTAKTNTSSKSKIDKPQSSGKNGLNRQSKNSKKPKKNNKRNIIISTVAILLVVAIIIGVILGTKSCNETAAPPPSVTPTNKVINDNPSVNNKNTLLLPPENIDEEGIFENPVSTTTEVGFSGEIIGEVERNKPVEETKDEGLASGYPTYGYTLSGVIGSDPEKVAARNALIRESSYLTATGTQHNSGAGGQYTWMDENGFLYSGTTAAPVAALDAENQHRQLYKHSASVGLYFGNVSEDEPRIAKKVTMRPRRYNSYGVTGIYAPAGEVIKIEISQADMEATGGITIHIGQALYNGQANNIWAEKGQMQRFPVILNTMNVNKNTATYDEERGIYTAYVGSFIGGPLYIRNTRSSFNVTISGGVTYSHFILGYTTKEEFEANKNSSAPYFDLEVWNFGVLHSGPKRYAQNFSYEDIYKAAILWEKVSSVTTTGSSQGIVFLYDPFVAAGAAVAFPGRSSVNCPTGWMASSLNYNQIVTSGAWGNFHEYHHNFQGYGVGNGGEVTNNGMTLVSYALFTKISSARGIAGYGSAGLGGWNSYTSATWPLSELLKIPQGGSPSNGNQGLTIYATLLHNFGANNYIQAKVQQQRKSYGQNYSGYLRAWQDITHNDMTYFFKDILQGIDKTNADKWKNPEYPTFVPVSSVYQTGRSFNYDGEKKYFKTMQPYIIPFGEEFNIDLSRYNAPNGQYKSGSVVIPEGFTYRIKSISKPEHGSIEVVDNYNFKYKPGKELLSGQIIATLEIKKNDKAFKVEDVDLVLEFEQSHETNKNILTRTTYTYSAENMYTDAQTAYENGYAGYESENTIDHTNPTQNANTDIWYYPNTEENHTKYPNAADHHFFTDNTVVELRGKIHTTDAAKYRFYLRGRRNCALYYSLDDGQTYTLGATIKDTTGVSNSHMFRPNDPNTYVDIVLKENSWIYFKEVLLVQPEFGSYIGLGVATWTAPMFTIVNKYYDAEGNEVSSEEEAVRTETHYYDYQGHEVTEEEANNAELIPPSSTSQPAYANAFRENYEYPSNSGFETDYFYTREYIYSYDDSRISDANQTCVESIYTPWDNTPVHSINNLFDDDDNTFIHSNRSNISESNPFGVTVELDKTITANRLIFHGSAVKGQYRTYLPKTFKIWVSENGEDWTIVSDVQASTLSNLQVVADFDNYHTFKYYKVLVTNTHSTEAYKYICLNKIELVWSLAINGGKQITPDNENFVFTGNWKNEQTFSTFGHVYAGENNSSLQFKFNGNRLALTSSLKFGTSFEVYIDGVKVNSIDLKKQSGDLVLTYLSDELEMKWHNVQVKCTGKANIDSIIIFD